MSSREPALSVVVVTRDRLRVLGPIVRSLSRQTVADRIELVVVVPQGMDGALPAAEVAALHSARIVTRATVTERGESAATGVAAARAPIVALAENHCFPEPSWAEALLAAHRSGAAGVGPAVINANPESLISQALHAFGYGQYHRGRAGGAAAELPLHNSSYLRAHLPATITELEPVLADERALQRKLIAEGRELRFDPGPVKRHLNESNWGQLIGLLYGSGRRYGGARARSWGLARRLGYAAATPLLAIPIARSIWGRALQDSTPRRSMGLAGVIAIAGLLHAIGEAISYLAGPKDRFPFLEQDEYLIRERLGRTPLADPEIAALVALADGDD
jgi:hypothetical protein